MIRATNAQRLRFTKRGLTRDEGFTDVPGGVDSKTIHVGISNLAPAKMMSFNTPRRGQHPVTKETL